jgi:hypothetical protein
MRQKKVSNALKHHRATFHLARHSPDRWEEEKNAACSESLCEARDRARVAKKKAEANKTLLKHSQQQVRLSPVHEYELQAHETIEGCPCPRAIGHFGNDGGTSTASQFNNLRRAQEEEK